jgi:hypothetical protein
MVGFVKAMRSDEAAFLDSNPLANHVLNVIARRARRSPCLLTGLQIGECFVGHKGLGLSEQQYRTVKKNLQKWGFVEFKKAGRVTDRGTVAKLLNSDVYDINEVDPNGTATEDQRKDNGRPTEGQRQTKNVISEEGKNVIKTIDQTDIDRLFGFFYSAYPKKVDKQKAVQKFGVIFRGMQPTQADELLDLIIISIEQRIAAGGWDLLNKQYIPSPAKYLLNKLWEDEIIGAPNGQHRQTSGQSGQIDPNDTSWGDEFLDQSANVGSGQQDFHQASGNLPSLEASHADRGKYRRG